MKLTVILEQGVNNWGAYTPDDIGSVIASGKTREEAVANFRSALKGHLEIMRQENMDPPSVTELDVQELVSLGTMAA